MKKRAREGHSAGIHFHPEAPLTAEELERLDRHRLAPVVRVASAQLCDWFMRLDAARRGEGEAPAAMVMGVLGGLGQGKSSVLHAVLRRVEALRVSRNLGCLQGKLWNTMRCWLQPAEQESCSSPAPEEEDGNANNGTPTTHRVCPRPHPNAPSKSCCRYWKWFPRLFLTLYMFLREGLSGARPPRILRIDTSLSKADAIEQRLFSLLLFPHLAWGVIRAAAFLFFAVWASFYLVGDVRLLFDAVNDVLGWSALAVIAILLPLLVAVWSVGTELGKDWYGNFLDVLVFKAARFLLVTPELLVIDDLDRAKVEQQRAVLRTLYKHARMLDCAVVVCFDERELLASKADPDAPEELLRKVVNFAVRIPPRTKEDAMLLATSICADWLSRNCMTPLSGAVANPLYAANLARVAWLLGQPSPRRIKDLLAQSVMMAQTRGAASQEDLSALLRVVALFQVLPEAAADSESLIRLLENNRKAAFESYANDLVTKDDTRRKAVVLHLLQRTRTLQPVKSGWRHLIGEERTGASQQEAPTAHHGCLPALWQVQQIRASGATESSAHARKFCLSVSSELERVRDGYQAHLGAFNADSSVFKTFAGPVDEAALAPFILVVTLEDSAEARLSLYQYWYSRLVTHADDAAKAICLPACLREWVADEEVWERMSPLERQDLLEKATPGTLPGLGEALGLLVAPVKGDFAVLLRFVFKHCATETNKDLAAALLRAAPVELRTEDLDGLEITDKTLEEALPVLSYAWPPLKPDTANLSSSLDVPLQALGRFQQQLGQDKGFLPSGVYAGLKTHAPLKPLDWLPGIQGLLRPDGIWRLDCWHEAWRGNIPLVLKDWIAGEFASPKLREVDNENLLVVLALCLADENWAGMRAIFDYNGKSGSKSLVQFEGDVSITVAIGEDADMLAKMDSWKWFWFDHIPDPSIDIQNTLQGRLIECVRMRESGQLALEPLATEFRKRYEEETATETLEIEKDSGTPSATAQDVIPETNQRRYIKGMYETYFRPSGAEAHSDRVVRSVL
jgi:hypothetical protein